VFDLRYHVASLAAVFLALVIGIVVGVGISGKGFVSDSERRLLNAQIADLQGRLDSASKRASDLARAQRTAQTFVSDAYPALMAARMSGKRTALVFIGPVNGHLRSLVEQALSDANGEPPVRLRALKLPIDPATIKQRLAKRPGLASYATDARLGDLGRRLGEAFVTGADAALWQLLVDDLVEEQSGNDRLPADAVVVVRTVKPQQGASARFLAGFYDGLAAAGAPAVGVETSSTSDSAIDVFSKNDLSSVDDVDTEAGRLALVLLLGGATPGQYGTKQTAKNGVLPPIAPLTTTTAGG
jgi:hypothetical protein